MSEWSCSCLLQPVAGAPLSAVRARGGPRAESGLFVRLLDRRAGAEALAGVNVEARGGPVERVGAHVDDAALVEPGGEPGGRGARRAGPPLQAVDECAGRRQAPRVRQVEMRLGDPP